MQLTLATVARLSDTVTSDLSFVTREQATAALR